MDVLFLMNSFGLHWGLKLLFQHICARKNLFLNACRCAVEMLEIFYVRWTECLILVKSLVMETRTWILCFVSKVFRLHALLQDAAGAVRSHIVKVPGYSYMIGRGPNSCWLGHVTGLLFCLHVKLSLLFISDSVDF